MKRAIAYAWQKRQLRQPNARYVYRSEVIASHPALRSGHDASQTVLARSGLISFESRSRGSIGTGKWLITEEGADYFRSLL